MNKMALFIKTPVPMLQDDKLEPDMGLLYCASYVKRHSECTPVYVDLSLDSVDVLEQYYDVCSIYLFSTFTANYERTCELVKMIRERCIPEAVFIAGGHHASALPDVVAQTFDYVIIGEGEIAESKLITELLSGRRPSERIIVGECIKDLDNVGWIDYSLAQLERYTRRVNGHKSISVLTSRGCPYKCEFCNSTLMKRYKSVRFRSAQDVIAEVLYLNQQYGVTSFRIQDDIFSINRARLKEIADGLEKYHFSFRCFARVDNIDDDILNDFKRMGIFHLSFGVESGSQRILDLMNKGTKVEDIRRSIQLAKAYGMKCRVYLIAGYPGETIESLDETISMIREVEPDDVSVYPLIPYPGTPLFENPKNTALLSSTRIFPNIIRYTGIKRVVTSLKQRTWISKS